MVGKKITILIFFIWLHLHKFLNISKVFYSRVHTWILPGLNFSSTRDKIPQIFSLTRLVVHTSPNPTFIPTSNSTVLSRLLCIRVIFCKLYQKLRQKAYQKSFQQVHKKQRFSQKKCPKHTFKLGFLINSF